MIISQMASESVQATNCNGTGDQMHDNEHMVQTRHTQNKLHHKQTH